MILIKYRPAKLLLVSCFLMQSLSYSVPAYTTQIPHWQDVNYIEKSFYEIALHNEYNNKQSKLRKWVKPLQVYIDHQVGDKKLHRKILTMHLSHLHKITRLPINYVNKSSQANVIIYLTQSSKVNKIIAEKINIKSVKALRNAVCLANIQQNNNSEITKAIVIIPVDRARRQGKLVSCFVEELTQILGLPNDSKTVYPTIFSDKNIYKLLTGLDYILLKLLYSPELKTGMSQSALHPVIQKKLRAWQKNGLLKKAQKEVIKGDLYSLMGYR